MKVYSFVVVVKYYNRCRRLMAILSGATNGGTRSVESDEETQKRYPLQPRSSCVCLGRYPFENPMVSLEPRAWLCFDPAKTQFGGLRAPYFRGGARPPTSSFLAPCSKERCDDS